MKYNNKSELIETIKSNANLLIKEYSDIEEMSMNKIDEEIGYSHLQMGKEIGLKRMVESLVYVD